MLTGVSMFAAPWRALMATAQWKSHAPHSATGSARTNATHCQNGNCRNGTTESRTTGSDSAAGTTKRSARSRCPTSYGSAAGCVPYPTASTAAMASAIGSEGGRVTEAFSVA